MPRTRPLHTLCAAAGVIVIFGAAAMAQASSAATPTPVTYASASELNAILTQVQQTSQNMQADLGKARIDRWKLDSSAKRDLQGITDSILRNLQSLPEVVDQLDNTPEDLAASFKLYRNLDALCDFFGPIVEWAGALGSKDESQSLSNDMSALRSARRALGDRMQNLAASKESELVRLRNQVKAMQASTPPPAPKKIIVDDTEPPKKPAKKKPAKPAAQKPPAATSPPASPK